MAKLSADDLFCMISFLTPQQILSSCCLVNRLWYSVSSCNAVWKTMCENLFMMDLCGWELLFRDIYSPECDRYYLNIFQDLMRSIPIYKEYIPVLSEAEEDLVEVAIYKIAEDLRVDGNTSDVDDDHDPNREKQFLVAKLATILTILSNSEYAPNPWTDKILVCHSNSKYEILSARVISLAVFCSCLLRNRLDILHMVTGTEHDEPYLAVSPFIQCHPFHKACSEEFNTDISEECNTEQDQHDQELDLSQVKPFCYFEQMDDHSFVETSENDEYFWSDTQIDSCTNRFTWVPIVFNAGAAHYEYTFKAVFHHHKKELHVKKYYNLSY
ncbi:hypothetical protein C9374_004822 [Naegleria lovaniensis]|uniref:F-box domain-containing protein n=1 Tax=Naegleria lovaniensis TaxID=51637 RepID=A0AA88GM88_NAELO|nr:uncharacterized protein C9374_004822 [Naegleria lovaniensis]KAG2382855.1 hypothetical protein C9374_004822 [Naegleria lovaniensis]